MLESRIKQIDQYEIAHLISSGKLSQVWQGYATQTEEPLFVEIGQAAATANGKFTELFTGRIDTIRQLDHPNVAGSLESGISNEGRPFTTYPYRAGQSLASWMRSREMEPIEALRLVRQVADGLAAAHTAGLIHKDLRPEMIFLTDKMEPILFGMGFSAEESPETAVTPEGTPEILDYPAPEVLKGKPASNQSNIYTLGIILYELLAQAKPRLPVSTWDIFERRSVPQPIPLEQTRPGLAPATYQVVRACLWWQIWNRYQTMAELVEALDVAIEEEEALLAPPAPKPKRIRQRRSRTRIRPIYAGAAALLLLVLLAGGWLLLGNRGGDGVVDTTIPTVPTEPVPVANEIEEQPDAALAANPEPSDQSVPAAVEPTAMPTASPTPLPSPTAMPTTVPTATAVPPTPTATSISIPEGMVLIPAGSFMMGSAEGQAIEMPVHEVTLSAYLLDQFEVTNAQYRACVEAGACTQTSFPDSFTVSGYRDELLYNEYPIVGVTWDQAFFYCNWAGKRLPTEAEWEYAARGPENLMWPWGNSFDISLSAASARDVRPVDSYPDGVSPFGIYNMAGNVAEWVVDVYDGSNFYANSPAENPVNQADGLDRVYRGGSFDNPDGAAYLTYRRLAQLRTFADVDVGFRCAANAPVP